MFYIVLWGFQWGFEKETFQKLISDVLYYFVRISVRFWKRDFLKFDFICVILFCEDFSEILKRRPKIWLFMYLLCEDFSEVLKKKLSKIEFLMFNFVLWGLQWGFQKETFQNLISHVLYYFEKYTLSNLISYVLYCFVRTSVRFWKRDFPKFDFLCIILFCEDFGEVLKKKLSKIWFLMFNFALWGFQWGFWKKDFPKFDFL